MNLGELATLVSSSAISPTLKNKKNNVQASKGIKVPCLRRVMTNDCLDNTSYEVRGDSLVVLCCRRDLVLGVGRPVAQDRAVDGLGVGAVGAVPAVATLEPRQLAGHGGEQVVEGPGDDDVVVEANVQGDDDDCVSHTCGAGTRCECRRAH